MRTKFFEWRRASPKHVVGSSSRDSAVASQSCRCRGGARLPTEGSPRPNPTLRLSASLVPDTKGIGSCGVPSPHFDVWIFLVPRKRSPEEWTKMRILVWPFTAVLLIGIGRATKEKDDPEMPSAQSSARSSFESGSVFDFTRALGPTESRPFPPISPPRSQVAGYPILPWINTTPEHGSASVEPSIGILVGRDHLVASGRAPAQVPRDHRTESNDRRTDHGPDVPRSKLRQEPTGHAITLPGKHFPDPDFVHWHGGPHHFPAYTPWETVWQHFKKYHSQMPMPIRTKLDSGVLKAGAKGSKAASGEAATAAAEEHEPCVRNPRSGTQISSP